MIEAPVGHHCPTCVNEARTQMRQVKRVTFARGMMAGRAGVVTLALVAANVVVYLVESNRTEFFLRYADNALLVAVNDEYYRMITAAFLHGSVLHLAFNMFALYSIGSQLEEGIGSGRFLALYGLSALGCSALSHFIGEPAQFSVGASGAVFGILGAYFVVARDRGIDARQIGGLILINLLIGAAVPHIDNAGHVGGLLTGGALGFAYVWAERQPARRQVLATAGAIAVVAVVIVVATLLRVEQLRTQFPFPTGVPVG